MRRSLSKFKRPLKRPRLRARHANDAILERQAEMKQLREQYAEKENEAKILLKRPTSSRAASVPAESPRLAADLASGMDPRLAKKKEKSRHRAEQHRVASAQGRIESWRDYESNYPEELDYYEIARAKVDFKLGTMQMMKGSLRKPLSLEVERRARGIVVARSLQRQKRLKSQEKRSPRSKISPPRSWQR